MKKLIALLISLVLVFSVSAMAFADTLIMATNASFPPYEFVDGDKIVGIDAEIAEAVATKLGYDFQIDDMEFGSIISAVQSGKASFGMAGMTVTEDRLQLINFSDSYATGIQVVIVPENSPITTVDDLFAEGANHLVGVQADTTGDIYCSDDIEAAGFGSVMRYANGNEAIMALNSGKIDCVVIDNEPAKAYVAANPGLKILETTYAVEDYAACFAKENTELLAQFNAALAELKAEGVIADIIAKYIPAE